MNTYARFMKGNAVFKRGICLLTFGVMSLFNAACLSGKIYPSSKELAELDAILQASLPKGTPRLKIVSDSDVSSFKWGSNRSRAENLSALRKSLVRTFVSGDVNGNGKQELVMSCVSPEENSRFHLVILEKGEEGFSLAADFVFDSIFFIQKAGDGLIFISFGYGTDWMRKILWDGNKYSIEPEGEMEP